MLNSFYSTTFLAASLKNGVAALGLMAGLCGTAFSQSADIFGSEQPAAEIEEPAPAPAAAEPAEVDSVPSRYAGAQLESYIAARAAIFSMKTRATDPFGLYQDPEAQRVVKQQAVADQPSKRQAAIPPTPLSEIIKFIRITTVMPSLKSFLVGTRSFTEGEEFPLVYQGKSMKMKVMTVSSKKILFRNLDNSEEAVLEMDMLPPGMIAGSDKIKPAGMASPADNLPLNLGAPIN